MVQQEISEKSHDVEELENYLKILLLPKDVNDGKSVIMEIRSGAGGEEAAPVRPQSASDVHHVRPELRLGAGNTEPQRN